MAYEASMTPVHLTASKPGSGSWGRTSGLSIIDRVLNHAELFPDGAPCQIGTGFSGLQVRRIATYAYRAWDCGANGANRTLVGCLPCNCSPTELHRPGALIKPQLVSGQDRPLSKRMNLEPEEVIETPTSALRVRRSST